MKATATPGPAQAADSSLASPVSSMLGGISETLSALRSPLVQRSCNCGAAAGTSGACGGCEAEERLGENKLQPKLRVNTPGDRFEQEADRIADAVVGTGPTSATGRMGPREQRRRPTRLGSTALMQRRATRVAGPTPEQPDHDDEARPAANGGPDGGLSDAIHDARGNGQRLPPATLAFMESRFGADFGGVRIHADSRADALANAVHAEAFTLGNEVFFAAGTYAPDTRRGRRLIAHELVHTIQQGATRPAGPAGLRHIGTVGRPRGPTIQRVAAYWVRKDYAKTRKAGTLIQDEIFADASPPTSMRQEVQIPNAARKRASGGAESGLHVKHGFADLYLAEGQKPIGVRFSEGSLLPKFHGLNTKDRRRRPQVSRRRLVKIDEGPSWVKLGEIKPASTAMIDLGHQQVEAYKQGIELAHDKTNEWATHLGAAPWPLGSVDWISSEFSPRPGQDSHPLVLSTFDRDEKGLHILLDPQRDVGFEVTGKLHVDPYGKGVWGYFYRPDDPDVVAGAPGLTRKQAGHVKLAQQLETEVVGRITSPALQPMPSRTPEQKARLARANANRTVSTTSGRVLQRKSRDPPRVRDHFRAKPVFDARQRIRRQFEGKRETKPFEHLRLLDLAHDAERTLPSSRRRPPTRSPTVTLRTDQGTTKGVEKRPVNRLYSWIDLWSRKPVNLLARFRERFGSAFVAVSNKIRSLKARVTDTLRDKFSKEAESKGRATGLAGVARRALKRALTAVARVIVPNTLRLVVESLVEGVKARLKAVLPLDIDRLRAAVDTEFQEFVDMGADLLALKDDIEARITAIIDRFKKQLERVKEIIDLVSTVAKIVKWAVAAVQCATPPAWGCLKLLFSQLTAYLADRALEYCPLQKRVNRLLLGLGFVRDLPRIMSSAITGELNEYVGTIDPRLTPLFADIEHSSLPSADEIGCEGEPSALALAYGRLHDALVEKYGEFGAAVAMDALLKISRESGFEEDDVLSASEVDELRKALVASDIGPIDLELMAERVSSEKPRSRATVAEFMEALEQHREAMTTGAGTGGTQPSVKAARKAPKGARFGRKSGTFVVTGGLSPDLEPGAVVLTLDLSLRGKSIAVNDVRAEITGRRLVDAKPPDDESGASGIEFDIRFPESHFVDVSKLKLGTVVVDGKTVPFTTYKLPAGLTFSQVVPVPGKVGQKGR